MCRKTFPISMQIIHLIWCRCPHITSPLSFSYFYFLNFKLSLGFSFGCPLHPTLTLFFSSKNIILIIFFSLLFIPHSFLILGLTSVFDIFLSEFLMILKCLWHFLLYWMKVFFLLLKLSSLFSLWQEQECYTNIYIFIFI